LKGHTERWEARKKKLYSVHKPLIHSCVS